MEKLITETASFPMTLLDTLYLFGLFIIFLGLGLLLYAQLLGVFLRLHLIFLPKLHPYLKQLEEQTQETAP